jgi:peptide/nickel transport system ATP-binding protein
MYAGRIVEAGPTSEVLAAPGHHYTGGLLQAAPSIDRIGHRPRGIAGTAPSGAEQIGCGFAPRCAHADELCRDTRPNLVDSAATPGHCVACHHPIRVLSADSASGGAA